MHKQSCTSALPLMSVSKDTCKVSYRGICFQLLLHYFDASVTVCRSSAVVELPDAQHSHAKGSKEAWLPLSGQTVTQNGNTK